MEPDFDLFWNFCINAPYPKEGIHEVICRPHIDAMNSAIYVCAVLVYYFGARVYLFGPVFSYVSIDFATLLTAPEDRREKVWLVIWEAGLIVQIPISILFLYPSALIMHFNIRVEGMYL